jgi:hypothetical protein
MKGPEKMKKKIVMILYENGQYRGMGQKSKAEKCRCPLRVLHPPFSIIERGNIACRKDTNASASS